MRTTHISARVNGHVVSRRSGPSLQESNVYAVSVKSNVSERILPRTSGPLSSLTSLDLVRYDLPRVEYQWRHSVENIVCIATCQRRTIVESMMVDSQGAGSPRPQRNPTDVFEGCFGALVCL